MPIKFDTLNSHLYPLSNFESAASIFACKGMGSLIVTVEIVGQVSHRNHSLDKEVVKFDEEPKLADLDDQSVELTADPLGHKDSRSPLLNLFFGRVCGSFPVTRLNRHQLKPVASDASFAGRLTVVSA